MKDYYIQVDTIEQYDAVISYCRSSNIKWAGDWELDDVKAYATYDPMIMWITGKGSSTSKLSYAPNQFTKNEGHPIMSFREFELDVTNQITYQDKIDYVQIIRYNISNDICRKFEKDNKVNLLSEPTKENIGAFNKFVCEFTRDRIEQMYISCGYIMNYEAHIYDINCRLDLSSKLKFLKQKYFEIKK